MTTSKPRASSNAWARTGLFPTLPTAVHGYVQWYAERHGGPPPGVEVPDLPPTPFE